MKIKTYLLILISSLIGCILGVTIYDQVISKTKHEKVGSKFSQQVALDSPYYDDNFERIFRSASPTDFTSAASTSIKAVVSILTYEDNGFRSNRLLSKSVGSGVLISENGYIVTNYHVVEDSKTINVVLNDKREFSATIVGFDRSTDLAVLKIDALDTDYLVFGNSDSLHIGEWVLAIGNPFKLNASVTAGIVSAKARNINIFENRGIEAFIQTDAAVNPGNSGGALINTNSELIGINTAIMTYSGKYEGFSFAIPSNLVKKVVRDIRAFGSVQRGWLGASVLEMNEARAKEAGASSMKGIIIDFVDNNGAAKDAGLMKNDIIVSIENLEVNSVPSFLEKLANHRPGDEITITFKRGDQSISKDIVLRNQLNTTELIAVRKDVVLKELGFEIRNLGTVEKDRLNQNGIIVISIDQGSKVDMTNMDPGYIITKINDQEIESADQFIEVIKSTEGSIFLEGFYENYPGKYPYTFEK